MKPHFLSSSVLALGCAALLVAPGTGAAQSTVTCGPEMLKGKYVFSATGFTRPPNSAPGTPWVPKGILEIIAFNGDGTLGTPGVTVANPFGDTGAILQPPAGAPGAYIVNEDCTGKVHFFDGNGVMFAIFVDPPNGDSLTMIQTSPNGNVFQGTAKRVR